MSPLSIALRPLGACPSCGVPFFVPAFAPARGVTYCPACAVNTPALLAEARAMMAESYRGADTQEVTLALIAHTGQYTTALLNDDKAAARAFLVNVIALGELLLTRVEGSPIQVE